MLSAIRLDEEAYIAGHVSQALGAERSAAARDRAESEAVAGGAAGASVCFRSALFSRYVCVRHHVVSENYFAVSTRIIGS